MADTSDRAPIDDAAGRWSRIWLFAAGGAIVVFAALLYAPWRPTALPIGDWGGMLPILTGESTMSGRFRGLMDSHVRDGRYQPAFMASIAITWSAFSGNTVAWQWIRFAVMTGLIIGCIALARRLGANSGAAAAAALLLVVSGMAQQSWVLLQLPEPRGTLVLVCAGLVAVGYSSSGRWPLRAIGIVALLVVSILYKETFIVAVPFVLALALWARGGGQWVFRRPVSRDFILIGAAVLAIAVVNVVPVLNVRRVAEAQAYGARYDLGSVSIGKLRNVISALLLPVTRVWWFPANLAFLATVVGGTVLGVKRHGRSAAMTVVVLLSLLLAGVVTYMPWFAMEGYYGLAFLPALVGLFALALTWLWGSGGRPSKALAVVSCTLLAVYGSLMSSNYVAIYRASRAVEDRAARALDGLEAQALFAAVPSPAVSGSFAAGLRGYAMALGVSKVPPGTDVACADVSSIVRQHESAIVVVFSALCGSDAGPGLAPIRVIRESFVVRDWRTFASSPQSVDARIWAAAEGELGSHR